jgi:benzoate-CoA ligase
MVSAADATAKGIFNMNSDDIVYSTSKLFFSYGLGNALYYPLRVGAAAVLSPVRPDPQVVFDLVKKYRPTVFCSVPTSYTAMLQAAGKGEADFSSVRVATSAGETLPEVIFHRWKERFGIELLDGLGCSEASNTFICNRPGEVVPGSTGKVVPGYEVRLVDEDGAIVPCGEIGTLQVKGDSLAAYYWNKHEKTKSSFLGHWFNTGDRFYQDEAGYLWYVGRTDDMLKVGGIWVSPIEVERTLLKHDCVLECGVVGKEDDNKLVKPKAFVVLKDGYEACEQLEQELKQFVKGQIAHYKYPRWIEFIPQLPKTATGKIQRYKLKEL